MDKEAKKEISAPAAPSGKSQREVAVSRLLAGQLNAREGTAVHRID